MTQGTKFKHCLPLNIQLFAESDSADGGEGTPPEGNVSTVDVTKNTGDPEKKPDSNDSLDKLIQSRVDRAMAEERKKSAALQKKLEKLSKEKLSDEEIQRLAIEDREKAIADKERELTEKENRLFAIKAIKAAGLDDGSDTALELVDLVISGANDTEETIGEKVKSVSALIKRMVSAEVDKTFKANGRTPGGSAGNPGKEEKSNLAEKLGKERAAQSKQTKEVLKFYTGGKS